MADAFKKWMSGDRHEDQYGNAQEALEVGFPKHDEHSHWRPLL